MSFLLTGIFTIDSLQLPFPLKTPTNHKIVLNIFNTAFRLLLILPGCRSVVPSMSVTDSYFKEKHLFFWSPVFYLKEISGRKSTNQIPTYYLK